MTSHGLALEPPERRERVKVYVTLTAEQIKMREHEAGVLFGRFLPDVPPGDALKLCVEFSQEYYGGVVDKMEALATICQDPRMGGLKVSCEELEHGCNLARRFYTAIQSVMERGSPRR